MVKRFCSLFLLMVALLGIFPSMPADGGDQDRARRAFRFAKGLYDRELYSEAADEFRKYLEQYGGEAAAREARFLLADCYYRLSRLDEAGELFRRFLKEAPEHELAPDATYSLAWVENEKGNREEALKLFSKTLEMKARKEILADSLLRKALLLKELGKEREALEAILLYLKKYPDSPGIADALYVAGHLEIKTGKYQQALSHLSTFVEKFPSDERVQRAKYSIGEIHYLKGDFKKALSCYQELEGTNFSKDAETGPGLAFSLGWCYYSLGDFKKSVEYFEKFRKEFAASRFAPEALLQAAVCRVNLKEFMEAVKVLEDLKAPALENERLYWLGFSHLKMKAYDKAMRYFEEASTKKGKRKADAAYMQGVTLFEWGKFEEAIDKFEKFRNEYPNDENTWKALFNIAESHFNRARYDKAIEMHRKIVETCRDKEMVARSSLALGEIYYLTNRKSEAKKILEGIEKGTASYSAAMERLGDIESSDGNYKSATLAYREAEKSCRQGESQRSIILFKAARSARQGGMEEEAFRILEELARQSKTEVADEARIELASMMIEKGDYTAAGRYLDEVSSSRPQFAPMVLYSRAIIETRKGSTEVAIRNFDALSKQFPDHPYAVKGSLEAARLALEIFGQEEGRRRFEEIVNLNIDESISSLAALELGYLSRKTGDIKQALKDFLRVEILYPELPAADRARLEAGRCYLELKMPARAKPLFEKAALSSDSEVSKEARAELSKL